MRREQLGLELLLRDEALSSIGVVDALTSPIVIAMSETHRSWSGSSTGLAVDADVGDRPARLNDPDAGVDDNPWFQRALHSGQGRIQAGGVERGVAFEEGKSEVVARVTAVYQRSTTLRCSDRRDGRLPEG